MAHFKFLALLTRAVFTAAWSALTVINFSNSMRSDAVGTPQRHLIIAAADLITGVRIVCVVCVL